MSERGWHVAVLIPARNEEDLLPRCLHSVLGAAVALPEHVTCDVVVAVDSSTDRTLEIARRLLRGSGTAITTEAGAVGSARALAANVALGRYRGVRSRCWLANTDADCVVPRSWLADQLRLAQSGWEAIAGTIDVDDFAGHEPIVKERFRATYLIRPDGSHGHVHGANLGVRADAYLRTGGWSRLATAEDHDLWSRLTTTEVRRLSSSGVEVFTSGRRIGRAPHGFAEALAAHNEKAA